MTFIHKREKNSICILTDKNQCILKVEENPLIFCQHQDGYIFTCGPQTVCAKINHYNNESSLDIFCDQNHIMSFMPETPERPACFSVYDNLPKLLTIPHQTDIIKNQWVFTDYRGTEVTKKSEKSHQIKEGILPLSHQKSIKKARLRER